MVPDREIAIIGSSSPRSTGNGISVFRVRYQYSCFENGAMNIIVEAINLSEKCNTISDI